jgi:hypothetical protein
MAAPTTAAEYVVLRRPSLSGDTRLDDMIAQCTLELDSSLYGSDFYRAIGLLTLHTLEMSESASGKIGGNKGGTGGAVTSETERSLSRSYDASKLSSYASDLNTTSWGIELTTLTRQKCAFMGRTRMM